MNRSDSWMLAKGATSTALALGALTSEDSDTSPGITTEKNARRSSPRLVVSRNSRAASNTTTIAAHTTSSTKNSTKEVQKVAHKQSEKSTPRRQP
jgi:hypothetical protein